MTNSNNDPDYLDRLIHERDAADFLGYTIRALQNWRTRGGGPVFVKISIRSIRYRRCDLIAWVESKLAVHTTLADSQPPLINKGAKIQKVTENDTRNSPKGPEEFC